MNETKIECLNTREARQGTKLFSMLSQVIYRDFLLFSQLADLRIAEDQFQSIGWPTPHLPPDEVRGERSLCEKSVHIKGLTECKYMEAFGESIGPRLPLVIIHV